MANTQLVAGSSANKLEELARRLDRQAEVMQQKDEKYEELKNTLRKYELNQINSTEVKQKIDEVQNLPQPDDIDNIEVEISETKTELLEISE